MGSRFLGHGTMVSIADEKKITIIGCGRLGLCLALCFDRAKYDVLAVDIFPDYVRKLNDRTFDSKEPRVNEFLQAEGCALRATCDIKEAIDHSDIIRGFLNPDMVLIGEGCKEIGDHMVNLYGDVCENVPVMGRMAAESAEICKIAINCFITTKISYCNMVGDIADRTPGAEKNEILQAVGADSRIGTKG